MIEISALSRQHLVQAIQEADLRVLLMVLVHLSGDRKWLAEPFRPKRDVRLIPDPSAGLSQSAQDQIRDAAVVLLAAGNSPVVVDPGDDLMLEMMSVCLGEDVAPEYASLNREEMGLTSRFATWPGKDAGQELWAVAAEAGCSRLSKTVGTERFNQAGWAQFQ